MKVVVFGAGGRTGELATQYAVEGGHEVTAFVHEDTGSKLPGVRYVVGDAEDADAVRDVLDGQEGVIDALGGNAPYKQSSMEPTAAENIVTGMTATGAKRLVVISMLGVGDSEEHAPFMYRFLLEPTYLRGADKNKAAMEAAVQTSGLQYVIVRPPVLTDDEPTGELTVVEGETKAHKITRGDLAKFLVEQLTSSQFLHQAVVVANS